MELLIGSVAASLIVGLILGWLATRRYYKRKTVQWCLRTYNLGHEEGVLDERDNQYLLRRQKGG